MSNVTIYEIAKVAGVSASTVSRVINNKPGVKPATRKKVLACLEEKHYSPNEAARGLVNQSSRIIGILLSDLRTTHHTDGIFFIQQELDALGYCCIIMNTGHEEAEKARYIQLLNQRRVEAAVLIGSTFETNMVRQAITEYLPNIPIFVTNGYLDLPNVYGVISDERNGVVDCVRHLAEKGRKNLAFVVDYETPSNLSKINGFQDGVHRFCGSEKTPLIVHTENKFPSIYENVTQLMKEHPEVDGIICAEDPIAASALRALRDMQIAVPDRVGVIGINNSTVAEFCNPSLTSLDNMLVDISVAAARNLADVIQGKRVVKKMMIYSKLVEREST